MMVIVVKMEVRDQHYLLAGRVVNERPSEEVEFEKSLKNG